MRDITEELTWLEQRHGRPEEFAILRAFGDRLTVAQIAEQTAIPAEQVRELLELVFRFDLHHCGAV